MSEKYWLNRWVFAADCDGHLVFLDVKNDAYYFVDREEARFLRPALYDVSDPDAQLLNGNNLSDGNSDIVGQMVANGLIVPHHDCGKPYASCKILAPINRFEHTESDQAPPLLWHHVVNGVLFGVLVHLALRFVPFRLIIWLFSKRTIPPASSENNHKAIMLATIYRKLRPFLYRSRLCLYDTFVFACFARIYGLSPTLVFGVTGEPFEAHCWAQYGSLILNDVPQRTGQYTPIMII